MAEREGTAEDFAAMAAALRGQDMPSKREAERELIESIHPAEPNEGPGEDEVDYARRLLAPKPEHERIARLLHPEGE